MKVSEKLMNEQDLFNNVYNPDVLACISNLSSDEVFTPPDVVNKILDMLPQELFSDPNTKFLDPACKTGVFLREIAKRLIIGLEPIIPDLNERINHIMKNQLYGIAITELTSLLSRRSLYCSKYANSKYSVANFPTVQGNIRFKKIRHTFKNGSCIYCGASKDEYDRDDSLEQHAYEFIHILKPEDIYNMKFDVICGNPPYNLNTAGAGRQAKPLYNLFVEQAKKLNPRYLAMIIPSRWFSGGMGLDKFRNEMMNDKSIRKIVDYTNSKDCFHTLSISGGVCYFLWDRDDKGMCEFTNIMNGESKTKVRNLNDYPVIVRYNDAINIIEKIHKVDNNNTLAKIVSSLMPFGLPTNYRGSLKPSKNKNLVLQSSKDITYISRDEIAKGEEYIDKYKVLISKAGSEHAGEPGKDGMFRVIPSSMRVMKPGEVCTHSYFIVGPFDSEIEAKNALSYLKTRFVRFLMLLSMSGFGLSKLVFNFVPMQSFSKAWTDVELYKKYKLNNDEIALIESMIRTYD